MEKCFDEKKIAKLTGTAVQDDETFKAEFCRTLAWSIFDDSETSED